MSNNEQINFITENNLFKITSNICKTLGNLLVFRKEFNLVELSSGFIRLKAHLVSTWIPGFIINIG